MRIAPGARSPAHVREEEEVLFVHSGSPVVAWEGNAMTLGPGDTLTVQKHLVAWKDGQRVPEQTNPNLPPELSRVYLLQLQRRRKSAGSS